MSRFLAVHASADLVYIEENINTIHHQLVKFQADPDYIGPKFYEISIDPDTGVPSLSPEIELKAGPRTQRAVLEVQELEAGGRKVGEVDVQV